MLRKVPNVAPLAGAWIEITCSREPKKGSPLAPLAGAWFEIRLKNLKMSEKSVAPLAGAWIEIHVFRTPGLWQVSLPSRERGLKYGYGQKRNVRVAVAPLA